jgi:hypothetical protein
MPSRRKLAVAVTQKIEALLRTNLDVNEVRLALNKKVSAAVGRETALSYCA